MLCGQNMFLCCYLIILIVRKYTICDKQFSTQKIEIMFTSLNILFINNIYLLGNCNLYSCDVIVFLT